MKWIKIISTQLCPRITASYDFVVVLASELYTAENSTKIFIMSAEVERPELASASESPEERTKDSNWQAAKSNLCQRNAAMLNNNFLADVQFIVGSPGNTQRIPAHKYVLVTGSSVFYTMFYGALAEQGDIEIPDVEPGAFLALLEYLYCDSIPTEVDTALDLLYLAKKYDIPHLTRVCVDHLETNLSVKNVWTVLCQSRFHEQQRLTQHCWLIIDAQTEIALSSDSFVDINKETLKSVLERDLLSCKEIHLWDAVIRWTSAECVRHNVEVTPANQRQFLEPVLIMIRFPVMTVDEFADGPAQARILSAEETTNIFLHFNATRKPKLCFPMESRGGPIIKICRRFEPFGTPCPTNRKVEKPDAIEFTVNNRIFIYGFGLYGIPARSVHNCSYNIKLKRLDQVVSEISSIFPNNNSHFPIRINFENPIEIEPRLMYTVSATMNGEPCYVGQRGSDEVAVGGVTFKFTPSLESDRRTGVYEGQIPQIFFSSPFSL